MDKYTVAHIVNANINKVLSALNHVNYEDKNSIEDKEVFELIRGLRIKNVYDGEFEEGITFENGYTVKECIIPIVKRG